MFSIIDQTPTLQTLWITLFQLETSVGARALILIDNKEKIPYER